MLLSMIIMKQQGCSLQQDYGGCSRYTEMSYTVEPLYWGHTIGTGHSVLIKEVSSSQR